MGKNLEKEHVLFVMETCKTSNTDTILQGLLGRVCGYSAGSSLVDVYLHSKIVDSGELQRYIDLTEGDMIIPVNACNIARTTIIKTMHPIVPILVPNLGLKEFNRKKILNKVRESLANPDFDFGSTDAEQFKEITAKLDNQNIIEYEVHNVSENLESGDKAKEAKWRDVTKKFKHFKTTGESLPITLWHTGIEKVSKKNGELLKEGRIINIFYYSKDNEYGIPAGSAYIYGVTECKNSVYVAKTNVPKSTGREVFAHSLEDGSEVVANGGFVIHMPLSTSRDLHSMKSSIIRFIELSLEFPDSRSVNSQWDNNDKMYKGIFVNHEVQRGLMPGGEIYEEVFSKYGFKITMSMSTEPLHEEISKYGSRYASISW